MQNSLNPILRGLLSPFSGLYKLITDIRNQAFERSLLERYQPNVPSIAIGNLSVGGTGKTPMTEYLIKNLKVEPKAVVSRGYGRKTKGLLEVNPEGSASDFGDESLQIAQKFPVKVWVSEERKPAVKAAEDHGSKLILLDDAFQHRYVKAHRYLMLSRFDLPFFEDHVLPGGTLREGRSGADRADFIIFTKCPENLSDAQKEEYRYRSAYYSKAPVLFSHLSYGEMKNQKGENLDSKLPMVLITGIADHRPLSQFLSSKYQLKEIRSFKDHHHFKVEEIGDLLKASARGEVALVCTDKDRVKLLSLVGDEALFSVPVEHCFSRSDEKLLLDDLQALLGS